MLPYGAPPKTPLDQRPMISDVEEGPSGRGFTVSFLPGQALPVHRNSARVVITVLAGSGVITLGDEMPQQLRANDVVRIEARVPHAIAATEEPMEIQVMLMAACCDCC